MRASYRFTAATNLFGGSAPSDFQALPLDGLPFAINRVDEPFDILSPGTIVLCWDVSSNNRIDKNRQESAKKTITTKTVIKTDDDDAKAAIRREIAQGIRLDGALQDRRLDRTHVSV